MDLRREDLTKVPAKSRVKYGFISANLLADLLVAQRDRIVSRLAVGGALAVAGILNREFEEIRRVYEEIGLRLVRSKREGEWKGGLFMRP